MSEGPLSGSGSPHLSGRQHRPRVGAVPAPFIGEGGRRAQLVLAVVEVEEVVEEVVRAVARKAALKKIHIRLALPVVARACRPDLGLKVARPVAGHRDEDRSLHPTTDDSAQTGARRPKQPHKRKCSVRLCVRTQHVG